MKRRASETVGIYALLAPPPTLSPTEEGSQVAPVICENVRITRRGVTVGEARTLRKAMAP